MKNTKLLSCAIGVGGLLALTGCQPNQPMSVQPDSSTELSIQQSDTVSDIVVQVQEESSTELVTATTSVSDVSFSTDDWQSQEFQLDGIVFSQPLSYQDFVSAGYVLGDEYVNEPLDSLQYTMTAMVASNEQNNEIRLCFKNWTDTELPLSQCGIYSVTLSARDSSNGSGDFCLCNGISPSTSVTEVIKIMGEPSYRSDRSNTTTLTYNWDSQSSYLDNSIRFVFDDSGLYEMEIINVD